MKVRKMTKKITESDWVSDHDNKSLSGIEIRDGSGKLINFITIKHDEILKGEAPHRISITLNENGQPLLPPPRSYLEIIRPGSSSAKATLSASASARQTSVASRQTAPTTATTSSDKTRQNGLTPTASSSTPNRSRSGGSSSKSKKKSKKKTPTPKPNVVEASVNICESSCQPTSLPKTPSPVHTPLPSETTQAASNSAPKTSSPPNQKVLPLSSSIEQVTTLAEPTQPNKELAPSPSFSLGNKPIVTSLKDLNKNHPLFKSIDPKEVKLKLKSASPGASIELSNGIVIKKSRRGGARVGAGRKRSRPIPGEPQASTSDGIQPSLTSNTSSSFSSQA